MHITIINRGRGPEIAGTRITVYDIMDYYKQGWHHSLIAATLRLSSAQVLEAIRYIEEHKEEVTANYQKILDRCARGNPPEIQAKLDKIRAEGQAQRAARRQPSGTEEGDGEGHPGGH